MQAVVFADRHGAELAPLCETHCPALLSVANRPLLHYTLDDLAAAGVDEILLVVSDNAAQIEASIGDGAMWGLDIRYLLSRGEEPPQRLLTRFAALLKPTFLAARGDVLRIGACEELMGTAGSLMAPVLDARIDGKPAGLSLVRQWPVPLPQLAWPLAHRDIEQHYSVPLEHALFAPLDSPRDFHHTALQLAGPHKDTHLPTGAIIGPGLSVGRLSQVDRQSHIGGQVAVGAQTWVHKTARISGPCIIGDDCYIGHGVQVRNSVVMPGSYIGDNLQVDNAIVMDNHLIRVDLDTTISIDEPKLLAANANPVEALVRQWPDRILGAILLTGSLPLWPLALMAAILANPHAPLNRIAIRGNRCRNDRAEDKPGAIHARQFATRIPLLRHLPMLSLVARGDLRLFGSRPSPANAPSARTGQSAHRCTARAAGLLGPATLYLSPNAPEEEIHLCELEFAARTGFSTLLTRLARAAGLLFSPRAWRPSQRSLGGA